LACDETRRIQTGHNFDFPIQNANTILDTEDNNINTELEEYTTIGDRNNVFSMIKMVMDRSSMRGEQIKSSLLDQNLTEKMIQQLSEKTGDSTSCVQMLLCKVFPYISTAQKATDETMNSLFGNSLQSLSQRWMDVFGKITLVKKSSRIEANIVNQDTRIATC